MGQVLDYIIADNFAGGGGVSIGIELATGKPVTVAINHDPDAIAMHKANHPHTKHYCENIWEVDPREVAAGKRVALAWFSPDCKHHSKARGGKPKDKNIRGLAWVAVRWAATVKPDVIILENVEEFQTWGPLTIEGKPDPNQKGRTFNSFVNALKRQGYQVDHRELKACDYGAPTSRKRFFLIARCDGKPIVWPEPTHGNPKSHEVKIGKLKPWRTAAEIIDWSIPCPSIFDRKKPLVENTMRRIARGLKKFVLDNPNPFIVQVNYSGAKHHYTKPVDEPLATITAKNGFGLVTPYVACIGQTGGSDRVHDIETPLSTIMTKQEHMVVSPTLIQVGYGEAPGQEPRVPGLDKPLGTIVAGGRKHALVAAFISKYYDGNYTGAGADLKDPTPTVTSKDHNALITSHLVKFKGDNIGQPVDEPIQTITAGGKHFGEVRAFLMKYYGSDVGQKCDKPLGTVTTKDRFGLVTIHGQDYQIVDIGMRMLTPKELFAAQGFPGDYIIDRDHKGKSYSQAKQVARCGNSVPPVLPMVLVKANLPELCGGVELEKIKVHETKRILYSQMNMFERGQAN